jgi:hypothetical protein
MGNNKREPTLEDLLSDPVMATLLEHAKQTPDDMRAMMRDAQERVAKASEPSDTGEEPGGLHPIDSRQAATP